MECVRLEISNFRFEILKRRKATARMFLRWEDGDFLRFDFCGLLVGAGRDASGTLNVVEIGGRRFFCGLSLICGRRSRRDASATEETHPALAVVGFNFGV